MSYSDTKSVGKIISSHNAKILTKYRKRNNVNEEEKLCNCQAGVQSCPLDGSKCLSRAIVYRATVTASDGEVKMYTGCTEPPFKKRLYRYRSDTSDKKYRTCTKLAGYCWKKNFECVAIDRDAYQ